MSMGHAAFPLMLQQPMAIAEVQLFGDFVHGPPRSMCSVQGSTAADAGSLRR
jgi:hypothetical protein